jgi:hypothetical protein
MPEKIRACSVQPLGSYAAVKSLATLDIALDPESQSVPRIVQTLDGAPATLGLSYRRAAGARFDLL